MPNRCGSLTHRDDLGLGVLPVMRGTGGIKSAGRGRAERRAGACLRLARFAGRRKPDEQAFAGRHRVAAGSGGGKTEAIKKHLKL
jgi:hypothetical protein